MKLKNVFITAIVFVTAISFAQKDELKTLKKIYAKEDVSASDLENYKATSVKLQAVAVEESYKVYSNFYKAMVPKMEVSLLGKAATPIQISNILTADAISNISKSVNEVLDFEKKSGKKIYTDELVKKIQEYNPVFTNIAIGLGDAGKYKESSEVLYAIYQLDKKDAEKLYYAANYAVNAKDYDTALKH